MKRKDKASSTQKRKTRKKIRIYFLYQETGDRLDAKYLKKKFSESRAATEYQETRERLDAKYLKKIFIRF